MHPRRCLAINVAHFIFAVDHEYLCTRQKKEGLVREGSRVYECAGAKEGYLKQLCANVRKQIGTVRKEHVHAARAQEGQNVGSWVW